MGGSRNAWLFAGKKGAEAEPMEEEATNGATSQE